MAYRIDYAPSNRAGCKGGDPCKGTKITKGDLRVGTMVTIKDNQTFHWRHWGCLTQRVLQNIKTKLGEDASEMDGYEDLSEEDQMRVRKAFEEGHVADEDVPPSQVPEGKKEPRKRKKKGGDDEEGQSAGERTANEDGEPTEKKPQAPAKKRAYRKAKTQEDDEETADNDTEAEAAPKKRARKPKKAEPGEETNDADEKSAVVKPKRKRAPPKKKAKKEQSEEELHEDDEE